MQATQSNNASGKRGLASPFTAPIEAARKYLDRQRSERLPGTPADPPDHNHPFPLPDVTGWEAAPVAGGADWLKPSPGGSSNILEDLDECSSDGISDDTSIAVGLRVGEELLFKPIENGGRGLPRAVHSCELGHQYLHQQDETSPEAGGPDEAGPVFTFEPSLAAPDPKEVRAAIFRLSRESKLPQRIQPSAAAASVVRHRPTDLLDIQMDTVHEQDGPFSPQTGSQAVPTLSGERGTAHGAPSPGTRPPDAMPSAEESPEGGEQGDGYWRANPRHAVSQDSQDREQARSTLPMAFADVARLVWSPGIAPARETPSNDQVEDASIMRDRRETLAAPEGPVSDSSSANLPQETRGKARESKLNLNREVIAEAANEARSDASLPGREAMTGPMTGPMNAETIGYLTSGLVREVTSDLISGETPFTPSRQAEHSIACERPAMAETAASRNLGRLTCPVSESSAELARDCTWAGPALAHDARNLLSALRLYGELLGFAGVLNAKHRHYADDLKLLAGRSQKLIERLLERSQERGQEFGKERGQGRGETQAATAVSVASTAYEEVSKVGEAAALAVARSGEDELRTQEVNLHQLAEPAPQRAEALANGMLQTDIGRGEPAVRAGISGADLARETDGLQLRGDGRGINSSMQMRESRESLRRISGFESNMERASSDPGGNISPAMAGEFSYRKDERGRAPAPGAAIISPAEIQVTAIADVPAPAHASPVNLVDLLLRWGSLLSTLAQGALEVRFGPRAATPIAVEAEAIERILVNLVRNAAAATRRGGAIRIAVGAQAKEAPNPRQQSERHEVMVLTVDDSGDGMTAQQVDRALGRHDHPAPNESAKQRHAVIGHREPRQELAEPFVSGYGSWPGCRLEGPTRETEPADAAAAALREFLDVIDEEERAASSLQWGWSGVPRHGLGLTIVRGLVRSSGGVLSIHSRPGLGTRIEISWPMVDVKRAPAALKKTSTGEGGGIWQQDAGGVEVPRRSAWPPDCMREEEIRTLDKPLWNAALGRRGTEIGAGGTQIGVGREGAIAC